MPATSLRVGSCRDKSCTAVMGSPKPKGSQLSPRFSVTYTPTSDPAYSTDVFIGSTITSLIGASGRFDDIGCQLPP